MGSVRFDSGALFKAQAIGASSAVAAGTGDATAVSGPCIDVSGYESAKFVITYKTTLGAAETLTFAVEYQQVDTDATAFETAVVVKAATVAKTGAVTAGIGTVEYDIPLHDKKRYFTINFTPNLSASGTDTAVFSGVLLLTGANKNPVSATIV